MKTSAVSLKKNSYRVLVGSGILRNAGRYIAPLKLGTGAFVITNSRLQKNFGSAVRRALEACGVEVRFFTVPEGERSKSFSEVASLLAGLTAFDTKRQVFIVALGGGVVGDLAGFVASIYRRGIPYIQVPTTLLAQVDSSIGGKTAVDLEAGKNLAGTIYQPRLVLSDVDLLKTLPARQLRAGLAEVIKYAFIRDAELMRYLEKNIPRILKKDSACLEHIVARCAAIKARIVSLDEREERGIRTILNFGHTIGHAIEAAAGFRAYNHGEAVALGMLVAGSISRKLDLIRARDFCRMEELIVRAGLPVKIAGVSLSKVIDAHYHDKKFKGASNRFVLLSGIGKTLIMDNVALGLIRQAIAERMGLLAKV